jgi:GAF domain-containing protein
MGEEEAMSELRVRVKHLEAEHTSCRERQRALLECASELMQLVATARRLRDARTRQRVLSAAEEVLLHLVGAASFGVFEKVEGTLRLRVSRGVAIDRHGHVAAGAPMVDHVAATGERYLAPAPEDGDDGLLAAVPIGACAEVSGVIAIYALPEHKPALTPLDLELLDLLSHHIGVAFLRATMEASRSTIRPPRLGGRGGMP